MGFHGFCRHAGPVALLLALAACDWTPSSAEEVGRRIDQGVENARERVGQLVEKARPGVETARKALQERTSAAADVVEDRTLGARVRMALIAEPGVRARDLEVEAKDGTVSLSGTAQTAEQKALAGKVAAGVAGVKKVRNNIVVAPAKAGAAGAGKAS